MSQKFSVFTYGCQMNRYDTETITGYLEQEGYERSEDFARADLILLNTCSIREKAEQKVYSQLGRLSQLKKSNPALKIAVCGCFATREGEGIARRQPAVDLIFGTQNIPELPRLLGRMAQGRVVDVAPVEPDFTEVAPIQREGELSAWVSIARGCDNFCTFCVVPYTRGPEWSKPSLLIVEEVERAVAEGFREVTLLGQNVNSYGRKASGELTFGGLLRRLDQVEGLQRVRFMTSHPKDCGLDMVSAMGECAKVCEHLHLPVQAGSDEVLHRMDRGYTVEEYLAKAELFRRHVPGGALTSDIIVGFPGETERDFEGTLRVLREARFDSIFMFKYSPRPGTPASALADRVPEEAQAERFEEALRLQRQITGEFRRALEGQVLEVMVEGPWQGGGCQGCPAAGGEGEAGPPGFTGRSRGNHRVQCVAEGHPPRPGDLAKVKILRGGLHALGGIWPPDAARMEDSAP
ncbi:MAG: tRNA (N6-isopentenyl adenosine(37)-C2)-methylthiotransferase MiaB [Nitrospinota bacterium]